MSRHLDAIISQELSFFKEGIELYLSLRDVTQRRTLAFELGQELLKRNSYWPIPQQWTKSKFATKESVAFRVLVQSFNRRKQREDRIKERDRHKVSNI